MALRSGMNFTASDMKKLLEENDRTQRGVRSWREKFGNASLAYGASTSALRSDYTDVISQAYKSNLAQQNTILGSGLSASAMSDAVAMSRMDLHNAYSQYISNYGKASNELAAGYQSELKGIDTMLTDRAKNFANLYSNAYTYLSDVLNNAKWRRDNLDAPIYEGKGKKAKQTGWEQIETDYLSDHQMAGLRDVNNNLLSWDQLSHKFFNPDGSLKKEGVEFFDQVFNARPEDYTDEEGHAIRSFDEWLSETDPELREWYASQDEFNYNFDGRNKGTASVMLGRESTDDAYHPGEYFTDFDELKKVSNFEFGNISTSTSAALRRADAYEAEAAAKLKQMSLLNPTDSYRNTLETEANILKSQASAARKATKQSWIDYQNELRTNVDSVYNFVKEKLGSSYYDEFVAENEDLMKTFEKYMMSAKKSSYANKQIDDDLAAWYNKFTKNADDFIRKHGYTGSSSGL